MGRLIPAHAGKTSGGGRWPGISSAHPRSRGENGEMVAFIDPISGSSLLTRGKPRPRLRSRSRQRLIPAHAGKTHWSPSRKITAAAHPRSRGENCDADLLVRDPDGSSPLTRGKPSSNPTGSAPCGLIPAHAGKTLPPGIASVRTPAHPRSRGENHRLEIGCHDQSGSSPLTRGKLALAAYLPISPRLIPAHAGKT